jgi:hypothetical protein
MVPNLVWKVERKMIAMAGIQHEVISPPKTCIGLRACEVDER